MHTPPAAVTCSIAVALVLGVAVLPAHAEDPKPEKALERVGKAADAELDKAKQTLREARDKAKSGTAAARDKVEAAGERAKETLKAAKEEAQATLREAKEELKDAQHKVLEGAHAGIDRALGTPDSERAARTREARRSELRALRPHVQRGRDIPPEARQSFLVHARRTARLLRIRSVAEAKGDKEAVARCDKLLALERAHHHARLARFWRTRAKPAPRPEGQEPDPDEVAPDDKAPDEAEGQP